MAAARDLFYEPSLKNIIDQTSLKWIFVGGKGGVGKTTVSCSLAIQLSRVRENVLIISTDPAHSLSDAFGQKLTGEPTLVEGFTNLHAMELDPAACTSELPEDFLEGGENTDIFHDIVMESCPGLNEVTAFQALLRLVRQTDYSVVVFDTAPAGHTLRMLATPQMFANSLAGLARIVDTVAPVASLIVELLGRPELSDLSNHFQRGAGRDSGRFQTVVDMLKDANKTTFVCVCLAEFLPLYETERLIDQLTRYGIDTHNIVVNQLNRPPPAGDKPCSLCTARHKLQAKYLEQIQDLYEEDFHITKLPAMGNEVRKADMLLSFSEYLLHPC